MRNLAIDDRVKHYAATEWRRGGMVRWQITEARERHSTRCLPEY